MTSRGGDPRGDDAGRRAAAFIESSGDPLARVAAWGLIGARPAMEAVASLESTQRSDGAYAGFDASPGLLATTLRTLSVLDDLGALGQPTVERVCAYLSRTQDHDGGWRPEGGASEEATLFTTGMVAGHLAKTRWVRPDTLAAAGDYLAAQWSPDRLRSGPGDGWPAIAAFAHFFANAAHDLADEALQWCGRELERGYRAHRFDAVRTARVFAYCDAGALPGTRIALAELVPGILADQAEDGGWLRPGVESVCTRVARTLDALVILARDERDAKR